jgi:hypothetical protein
MGGEMTFDFVMREGMTMHNVVVSPRPEGNTELIYCGVYVGNRKCGLLANWDLEFDNPNPAQSKRIGVRMCDEHYGHFVSSTDIGSTTSID